MLLVQGRHPRFDPVRQVRVGVERDAGAEPVKRVAVGDPRGGIGPEGMPHHADVREGDRCGHNDYVRDRGHLADGAVNPVVVLPRAPRPDDATGKETGISLTTDDIDATHTELKALGVDVDAEVSRMGDPVPPMFWFRDPSGHTLMVVQTS